jgi:hypothetical protein
MFRVRKDVKVGRLKRPAVVKFDGAMSAILDKFGRRFEDKLAVLIDATLSEALGGQGSQNPANPDLWTYASVAPAAIISAKVQSASSTKIVLLGLRKNDVSSVALALNLESAFRTFKCMEVLPEFQCCKRLS